MERFLGLALWLINLVCLFVNTVSDIKTKEIYLVPLAVSGAAGLLFRLACSSLLTADTAGGLMLGLLCLLLAKVTKESIGYGDALVLLSAGIGLGGAYLWPMCLTAAVLAAAAAGILLLFCHRSRKEQMPALPFLLVGFLWTGIRKEMGW